MVQLKKISSLKPLACLLLMTVIFLTGCEVTTPPTDDSNDDVVSFAISGTVTSTAGPLRNVMISLDGSDKSGHTVTGTTGKYTFSGLPAGTYRITPALEGYTFNLAYMDITLDGGDRNGSDFTATAVQDPEDPTDPQDPGNDDNVVTLMFAGDINLGTKVGETVEANGGDYTFPFINMMDYIGSFDLAMANLESIISDKGETTKPVTGVDLRAAPAAARGLADSGFDIVSVANNHAGDFGEEAMTDSFARLDNAGIYYAGGGLNRTEAHAPVIRDMKGTRIAVLSYTNVPMYRDDIWVGQAPTSRWIATAERPGIAWAHDSRFETFGTVDEMEDDIAAAAAQADIVVVMVHFGWEYKYEPDDAQVDLAHRAVDAGADFVIGHHSHVIQKYQAKEIENYHSGYIAYSLGNFVFDISEEMAVGTTQGLVIEATIEGKAVTGVQARHSRINSSYQVTLED